MQHFLLGCLIGGAIAACVAVPLFGPWRFRVRYLVSAPTTDPWLGLGLAPRLDMRAVRLTAVEARRDDIEIVVDEVDLGHTSHMTLARAECPPSGVAKLEEWTSLRVPLLMIVEHGRAHVYGPDGAVTNLRFPQARRVDEMAR